MTTAKFIKDTQSRITRYSINCFQIVNGYKCHASANAILKGKNLIINENNNDLINEFGVSIVGVYKIIEIGKGKLAQIICEKI